MEQTNPEQQPKSSNTNEELEYLRDRIVDLERKKREQGQEVSEREIVDETLRAYEQQPSQEVLARQYRLTKKEVDALSLGLSPDKDDETMMVLLEILQTKGIKNALEVVRKMNNPHLTDDFHRMLVQYVRKGYSAKGLQDDEVLWRVLNMTLYEVYLPEMVSKEEGSRPLKEMISSMEQFYAGMLSIADRQSLGKHHFVLEIAVSETTDDIVFYVSVPTHRKDLFEKHLLSIFPNAQITEQHNDYNMYVDGGVSLASVGVMKEHNSLPIKTYEHFDYDPLNVVLNAFSKIEREGGGAALQIIFNPVGEKYLKKYKKILKQIKKGKSLKEATRSVLSDVMHEIGSTIVELGSSSKEGEEKKKKDSEPDQTVVEGIQQKISTPVVETNIRLVASAETEHRADDILSDLESTFNQFENTQGNKLTFKRLKGSALKQTLQAFSFRSYKIGQNVPLSLKELTSLVHFPPAGIKSSPQFKQSRSSSAPAPSSMPTDGTLLGKNVFRNVETQVHITTEDRMRHFYVIGQTGTGKTNLLKNMIVQDIANGDGVCMIDPHGEDVQEILSNIPPERYGDVIYFDPGYIDRVMAFNMLEYDPAHPEQKTFVIDELFNIFKKLYSAVPESMGPMFEQYFRNATALVLESPQLGNTLLDVARIFADRKFRRQKIEASNNPVVNQFWNEIASKTHGEAGLENMTPYITNKFDVFLANEIMRPIIGQERSSFNFREVIDGRKILLVNLSKGRLGDINANLLGLILVGKILMATLSRSGTDLRNAPPFYLYIDEFQNITTSSIATILSEARKYRLSLTIAHQFIAQLQDEIKTAVFGNVGSLATFRVGSEDAEFLEKQYQPVFAANDIVNLENFNAYAKILVNGTPAKPFNMKTYPFERGTAPIEELKRMSYEKYGQPREQINQQILEKYIKTKDGDLDDDYDDFDF